MQNEMDVIIPSFRLLEDILLKILSLPVPQDMPVHFYIIADNPAVNVPDSIRSLAGKENINIIINETNLGFSQTRNKGIMAGNSPWILLLDDDVIPDSSLLFAYNDAIKNNPDSIGFIGVTDFPEPFNSITKAIYLNGSVGHFQSAKNYKEVRWAPTANVVLNRKNLGEKRFDPQLIYGGEDILLLTVNSFANNKKYNGVPAARVVHPWWNNGKMQLARMFRYGIGSSDIMDHGQIKPYTYRDFTNTSESLLIILMALLISLFFSARISLDFIKVAMIMLLAEFLTNIIKSIVLSKSISLALAGQMMLHKNASETGGLLRNFQRLRLHNFAKRLDTGFIKLHPSPFRLNRWKIIKTIIIGIFLVSIFF